MTQHDMKKKTVKAWAAINNYDGNLIAYGKRGADWSHAIFPSKEMLKSVDNSIEEVLYKIVPCTITYFP